MAIKIADKYKAAGYYASVWGKKAGSYRAIFALYDASIDDWIIETARTVEKIGTTKPDAKKWIASKVEEFNKRGKTATLATKKGKTNFAVFAERYKQFLKESIKGWEQEIQKVDTLVGFFGNDDLKDIDFDRIEDFKRWFTKQTYTRKDGGKEFKREKSTVHRYLARLRHLQRNAADRYQTPVPTYSHFIKKAEEKPKKTVITFDEFKRMLKACDDLFPRKPENRKRWRLVLMAAYTLGVRVNELFEIRRGDIVKIDAENRVGVIGLQGEDTVTKKHKKTVEISEKLFVEMEAAGCFEKAKNERLFMWTKAYRKPFAAIKEKAGVNTDAEFKSLRASNATARDASGQDFRAIQDTLGHVKDSDVTSKHYIDRVAETVIEKAKPFNDYLNNLNWSDDDVLDAETLD
jgi:integrase